MNFDLTEQSVLRLMASFEDSDLEFLHVRSAEGEVLLSRSTELPAEALGGSTVARAEAPAGQPPAASTVASVPTAPPPPAPQPAAPAPESAAAETAAAATELITAETVGVFYRAARPDLPPYVDVVEAGATVGLIEAMKVFTAVESGVTGTVTEILADNNEFVEFGQPLFRVAVDG